MERALWRLRHVARADGWVSVPIPWHWVGDPNHRGKRARALAGRVAALWRTLDLDAFPHFTVMVQSHLEQVRGAFRAREVATGDAAWAPPDFSRVVVFDTRLTALGTPAPREEVPGRARARVPTPLLHGDEPRGRDRRRRRTKKKRRGLFWAGGCHARARCGLQSLGPDVRACGDRLEPDAYAAALDAAAWALAPRGTTHATFALAEAVRSRALPVVVDDGAPVCVSRETCCAMAAPPRRDGVDVAAHLPFADIGLDWNALGLVVDAADARRVPAMIAAIEADKEIMRRRRDLNEAARDLFTPRGVAVYVAYKLRFCAADLDGPPGG